MPLQAPVPTKTPGAGRTWEKVHRALAFSPREGFGTQRTLTPEGSRDWLSADGGTSDPHGWYTRGKIHIIQMKRMPFDDLLATAVHAVEDAMVADMTVTPKWLDEGLAQLVEHELVPSVDPVYKTFPGDVKQSNRRSWHTLGRRVDVEDQYMVYLQGHSFIRYVDNKHGRAKLLEWLRGVGSDGDVDRASRVAFGLSWSRLDIAWVQTIAP